MFGEGKFSSHVYTKENMVVEKKKLCHGYKILLI